VQQPFLPVPTSFYNKQQQWCELCTMAWSHLKRKPCKQYLMHKNQQSFSICSFCFAVYLSTFMNLQEKKITVVDTVATSGVALIVWLTTNRMCEKNNTIIYVARASNSKRDCEHDLYCCLLPQCEALRTCCSGFPIATKWCCDQDVEVVPSLAFTQKERAIDVVHCEKEVMLLQPLRWCSVDCVILHERDVHEE